MHSDAAFDDFLVAGFCDIHSAFVYVALEGASRDGNRRIKKKTVSFQKRFLVYSLELVEISGIEPLTS